MRQHGTAGMFQVTGSEPVATGGPVTVRIDIRPNEEAKARLDQAAARLGLPTSSFVLAAALERAQEVLAREQRVLSDRDRDRVMALLNGRPAPRSAALKNAMRRHSALVVPSEE